MTMRFRYFHMPRNRPVTVLGGRFVRPRPLIHVSVVGPTRTIVQPAGLSFGGDEPAEL